MYIWTHTRKKMRTIVPKKNGKRNHFKYQKIWNSRKRLSYFVIISARIIEAYNMVNIIQPLIVEQTFFVHHQ